MRFKTSTRLAGQWFGFGRFLELVWGEQAAIGKTGPPVFDIDDATDLGLEGLANFVEEVS